MSVFQKAAPARKHFFGVLQGGPGVGKTSAIRSMLAAGFPGVAHIDTNGGSRSIADLMGADNYLHADCPSHKELSTALAAVGKEIGGDWVAYIDTMTAALQNKKFDEQGSKAKLGFDGWGEVANIAERLLRMGKERKLKRHLLMSVHEEMDLDGDGQRLWRPSLAGKAAGKIFSGELDFIWRMTVERDYKGEVAYKTYTEAQPNCDTKFRCTPAMRERVPGCFDSAEIGKYLRIVAEGE